MMIPTSTEGRSTFELHEFADMAEKALSLELKCGRRPMRMNSDKDSFLYWDVREAFGNFCLIPPTYRATPEVTPCVFQVALSTVQLAKLVCHAHFSTSPTSLCLELRWLVAVLAKYADSEWASAENRFRKERCLTEMHSPKGCYR
ncbi:hypothetical protein CEXT_438181 [Caerostris extrusa]|uniref:Uncharacterized protein n=1 Tax=Caerostris extrusa TaxID=172846 RepID=A0AAV4NPB8_CAEEX|nr:hypothetical protein CEXT_438181 [Caerostris extrusa]